VCERERERKREYWAQRLRTLLEAEERCFKSVAILATDHALPASFRICDGEEDKTRLGFGNGDEEALKGVFQDVA